MMSCWYTLSNQLERTQFKPCVTQTLRDTAEYSFPTGSHRLPSKFLTHTLSILIFNFNLFFLYFYFYFLFHLQAEHLQFTADSTFTKGEIPEVQFGRLNIFHLLTGALQHSQNFLK